MCAEQRAGTGTGAIALVAARRAEARRAADTAQFAGQPADDQVLAELGERRAAWVDPTTGTVIQVGDFERPADDPRPAVPGFTEHCGYWHDGAPGFLRGG